MIDVDAYDHNGNKLSTDDLVKAMCSWSAVAAYVYALGEENKKRAFVGATLEERQALIASRFAIFVSRMVEFTEDMMPSNTPYVSAQVMLSGVLEFMFSAMLSEKKEFGKDINPSQMTDEFMGAIYLLAKNIIVDVAKNMEDGTFVQRIMSKSETLINSPSTITKQ